MEATPKGERWKIDGVRTALDACDSRTFTAQREPSRRTHGLLRTFDATSKVVLHRERLAQNDHRVAETPGGKGGFGLLVQGFEARLRNAV